MKTRLLGLIFASAVTASVSALSAMPLTFEKLQSNAATAREELARGNARAARDAYSTLLQQIPSHPDLQLGLAHSQLLLGERAAALRTYRQIAREGLAISVVNDPALSKLRDDAGILKLLADSRQESGIRSPATVAFNLPDPRFIPEGLAFDRNSGRFFASSTYLRKILVRDRDGSFRDFVKSGDHGLLQVLGLKIDSGRRLLFACTGADDNKFEDAAPANIGKSALFIYDLDTAKLVKRVWVRGGGIHLFNDLIERSDGNVYITDSREGRVYRYANKEQTLTPLTLRNVFLYPNGITIDPTGRWLYVADVRGIWRVNSETGWISAVKHGIAVTTAGIDGLYFFNKSLVGVQIVGNSTRVIAFYLSRNGNSVNSTRVLERADPRMSSPTEGVVVGTALYFVANSEQDRVDDSGKLSSSSTLPLSRILKLQLPHTEFLPNRPALDQRANLKMHQRSSE